MKFRKIKLSISILAMTFFVLVGSSAHALQNFEGVTVDRITANDWGNMTIIWFSDPTVTYNEGCSQAGRAAIHKGQQNYLELKEVLTLAFVLRKPVMGWISGCHYHRPVLIRADIVH